jgi:hypothetical protein
VTDRQEQTIRFINRTVRDYAERREAREDHRLQSLCADIALAANVMSEDELAITSRFLSQVVVAGYSGTTVVRALAGFMSRLMIGRVEYGPLNLETNTTNWRMALAEEEADCAVYTQILALTEPYKGAPVASPFVLEDRHLAGLVLVGTMEQLDKRAIYVREMGTRTKEWDE